MVKAEQADADRHSLSHSVQFKQGCLRLRIGHSLYLLQRTASLRHRFGRPAHIFGPVSPDCRSRSSSSEACSRASGEGKSRKVFLPVVIRFLRKRPHRISGRCFRCTGESAQYDSAGNEKRDQHSHRSCRRIRMPQPRAGRLAKIPVPGINPLQEGPVVCLQVKIIFPEIQKFLFGAVKFQIFAFLPMRRPRFLPEPETRPSPAFPSGSTDPNRRSAPG